MSDTTNSGFPPTMAGYISDISKMFKSNCYNTTDSRDIIAASAHDIGNYVAKYGMANFQIQAIMALNGRLDYDKLVKAVRISMDAEPVLGCRFIKSDPPYWKRFEDIDDANKFCSIEESDSPEEGIQRFTNSPMNMDDDPMVLVKVIRSGTNDTLCIKINHVCSDAAGAKEYIQLLSDIYSRLERGDKEYIPTPSNRDRKDLDALKIALGDDKPQASWGLEQQFSLPTWNFPWISGRMGKSDFALCRLPHGKLEIMNRYSKARGATINDLILTAVFRAMFKTSAPPYGIPMDIPITIDLRRYLPERKASAIRNLSGGLVIKADRRHNEPFDRTLSRVVARTKEIREKHPSMLNILWHEQIERMSFRQICAYYKNMGQMLDFTSESPFYKPDMCSTALSNVGVISRSLIQFGKNTVVDAYILPPVVRAPGILLVASTYNDILTFAVGYHQSSVGRAVMEGLLNKIRDELVEGCTE